MYELAVSTIQSPLGSGILTGLAPLFVVGIVLRGYFITLRAHPHKEVDWQPPVWIDSLVWLTLLASCILMWRSVWSLATLVW